MLREHAVSLRRMIDRPLPPLKEGVKLPTWAVFGDALPLVGAAQEVMVKHYKAALVAATRQDWKRVILELSFILSEVGKLAPLVLPGVSGEILNIERYAMAIRNIGMNFDQSLANLNNLQSADEQGTSATYMLTPDMLSQSMPIYLRALGKAVKTRKRYWVYQKLGDIAFSVGYSVSAFTPVGVPYDQLAAVRDQFAQAEKQAIAQDRY